ncbi:hypothetical protein ACJ73_03479 [Blastomyces percursus]|uniref:Uncharacterized protein n=1 Tax=Blastomyces percursus TaxID=1658174 RepID=A0A1J9QAT1_9EURO|nr:hypothetical protein ACJ73_03479 [Blastomyces percursus]
MAERIKTLARQCASQIRKVMKLSRRCEEQEAKCSSGEWDSIICWSRILKSTVSSPSNAPGGQKIIRDSGDGVRILQCTTNFQDACAQFHTAARRDSTGRKKISTSDQKTPLPIASPEPRLTSFISHRPWEILGLHATRCQPSDPDFIDFYRFYPQFGHYTETPSTNAAS